MLFVGFTNEAALPWQEPNEKRAGTENPWIDRLCPTLPVGHNHNTRVILWDDETCCTRYEWCAVQA